jgi:hypothetical protein
VWVVQVGAFADDARASVLVSQLAAGGFTAFKSVTTMRNGTPLHVVLVGPFAARPQAAAALDKIEELPGVGQPILQLVPPAAAVRETGFKPHSGSEAEWQPQQPTRMAPVNLL